MSECTTHHHACDCREQMFAEIKEQRRILWEENQRLRDLVKVGIAPDELDAISQTLGFDAKALLEGGEQSPPEIDK